MSMCIWDPNMDTAYLWGCELFQPLELPQSLEDVHNRAKLVSDFHSCMCMEIKEDKAQGLEPQLFIQFDKIKKSRFLKCIDKVSKPYFRENTTRKKRINISLRLWSGCLAAAKNIAGGTRSGQNNATTRSIAFSRIDVWSKIDSVYRSGVESAPVWKRLVDQGDDISFDGVPTDSPVRRYANT